MSTSSNALSGSVPATVVSSPVHWGNRFLIAGIVLMLISLFGLLFTTNTEDPARPFMGWLIGVSFWLSVLIGMLFLIMIWWMFDSGWSVIIRRQFEHVISAFPWLGLLLLPLVYLGITDTETGKVAWTWMNLQADVAGGHGVVGEDVLYLHKAPYLNNSFFVFRFFLYFAVWIGLAWAFRRWSFQMDTTGDHKLVLRSRRLAAFGLFLCAFATSFASIDWYMSLNYHWFSTMYGVWFFSASIRAALSIGVLILFYQASRTDGLKGIINSSHLYLMGCIMLAFTVFWAYISFCQYYLIYSANIPEETFWYNIREMAKDGGKSSWWWVSLALLFLHFMFPFLFLLWRKNKENARLKFIAIWILVFHLLDIYWNIVPQKIPADNVMGYYARQFSISWIDITVLLGTGAIVIWAYLKSAASQRHIPVRDPRINESLNCHE